jgi:HAE1 family hydrophobic/amphiphilic exporter-1
MVCATARSSRSPARRRPALGANSMFLRIFVERPILSGVIAALILLAGGASIPSLPIAQYPEIAPPTVTVTSTYIGADAATVEAAVTNPLEEQINGVQGLAYMSSQSSNAGISTITITFDPSRNVDAAAVDVQNRVQNATGELPTAVNQTGVQITKSAGSFIMAIAFTSKDPNVTPLELSNYLDRNVKDPLLRINGVSSATIFGERRYAMRIWLDPRKLQFYGLGASDVTTAVTNQNVEVPAGSVGAEPAPAGQPQTINVHVPGELADAGAFGNIIVKNGPNGSIVRLSQVARVELGAQDYSTNLRFDRKTALGIGIQLNSGANALTVASAVRATLDSLKSTFPSGVDYSVPYDTTLFVSESLREVIITLIIAILLVVATIYLFLQDWRTTLIPVITIPISLIGTFSFVTLFGFSINTLVLFGLTLATGLVVDDAIVVIENIARVMRTAREANRRETTVKGLGEIVSAVIATSLVLLAVFIPTALIPGTTGAIYKQFALTIAFSISLSAVLALTLTPALAALLMSGEEPPPRFIVFRKFNEGLAWLTALYGRFLDGVVRLRYLVFAGLAGLLVLTYLLFIATPSGFLPDEDQGAILGSVQAPDGSSLNVTGSAIEQVENLAFRNPNVEHVFAVGGYSFNGGEATNQGLIFLTLKPWGERKGEANGADGVIANLFPKVLQIPQASVVLVNPPSIPGLGTSGGFDFELEDFTSGPLDQLGAASGAIIGPANADPRLTQVYTTFRANGPQINAVVNRAQVAQLGASLPDVFNDISTALGSTYVNNFTYLNRTYRVYVQNDAQFRKDALDVSRIVVPNTSATSSTSSSGSQLTNPSVGTTTTTSIGSGTATVPLASLVDVSHGSGPPSITHYNLYRSVEIQGSASPGHSSGQAIAAMESLAKRLPSQFHYQWTGISLDETQSGSTTILIFALGLIVVYLVLAALYESLGDPLVILLSVPAALLGAVGALLLRHITSDVYAQIGYVMLIGLAAKNAILIVEFAIQERATGKTPSEAVIAAAQTRLRPILMTSVAFIAGLLPLVFANGAGSASRHSLGTAVVGGMLVSTVLNLIVVPAMYLIVDEFGARLTRLGSRLGRRGTAKPATAND